MSRKIDRRVENLEAGLTPKQAIISWLQEAHAFKNIEEYVRHLKKQPDTEAPLHKLTDQVAGGVRQTLKGKPRKVINRAVRQAYRDVLFLFYLHQQVNSKVVTEGRHYWSQAMLLTNMLGSLLREQAVDDQVRWNQIRIEMQMPYPLDPEAAAAVDAAKRHHVLTWEVLEEGDDVGQWVRDAFVAEGKTLLPDGAYSMKSETKASYIKVPTEDEIRRLFQDDESYLKFVDGDDYSYGLSDVTDVEYDAHYEAIVEAVKSMGGEGFVVDLPTVPHQFLSEAPLVDGDWIDRYVVEMAEWGARMEEKGFLLEESQDHHPLAWHRIIDLANGSEVDTTATEKLWQQTRKHLLGFPGRTKEIDGRVYLSFGDYLKWRGRRNKGNIKSGKNTGLVVARWNQWMQGHGGEHEATLAGVKPTKLGWYLEGNRYHLCSYLGELTKERCQRQSLMQSLWVGRPNVEVKKGFRQRAEEWKELAFRVLSEIYTLRVLTESINKRYFEGQGILFPSEAEGLHELLNLMEKAVDIYNEDLAGSIERVESLLNEAGNGQSVTPLTINLSGLVESVQAAAKDQVAYMVDMAKADALDLLGEPRQALELVDRHV